MLLVLAILPLLSMKLDGRYLLVDINENVLPNLTADGYTNHYGVECRGLVDSSTSFRIFEDAISKCNRENGTGTSNLCGCIDNPSCGNGLDNVFRIHLGFSIKNATNTWETPCAWVKS